MNKIFKTTLAVFFLVALSSIYSCTKTCDPGYEGDKCDVKMNTKFDGTYAVHDTATQGSTKNYYTYSLTIDASTTNPTAITLSNFGGFGAGTLVHGTVDGINFTVSDVTLGVVSITNGTGSISGDILTFNYTAYDSINGTFTDHAVGLK